jgi:uncharacterized protein (DUF433 family)
MKTRSTAVEIDPDKMSGEPVFKGTRVPVQNLFDYLEHGSTLDDFLAGFPSVSRAQAEQLIEDMKEKSL